MLLQFSVENFRSIKEKVVFSLEASSDKAHPDNVAMVGTERVLKGAAVFGANAAGKSNLFKALTAAITTVRTSNVRQIGEQLSYIYPFAFDKTSAEKPTSFEFVFLHEGLKYVYGFSATRDKVVTEYLYVYKSSKATTVFKRDEFAREKYRFTNQSLKKQLEPLVERNTDNKLFLATSAMWNCEETKAPMMWFMQGVNTFDQRYGAPLPSAGQMFEEDTDGSLRRFMKNILRVADINISDYEFKSFDKLEQEINIPGRFQNVRLLQKELSIRTIHDVVDENGEIVQYKLDLSGESRGAQNLFFFSPFFQKALLTGETLFIDEFDAGLHPTLVLFLFNLFNNPDVNKSNAQLIISSHTIALLDLQELRRDQIYFMSKDQNTGASELYSLDEFSPRTREDICKAYMLGRYGAVPFVGEGAGLWE